MASWTIVINHGDYYSGWSIQDTDFVFVTAKGFPTVRHWLTFKTRRDAERFFEINQEIIERRCANRYGFHGFEITEVSDHYPAKYDEVRKIRAKTIHGSKHRQTIN